MQPYLLSEKKIVARPTMTVANGSYGVILSEKSSGELAIQWVHCREQFQGYDIKKFGMLFSHANGKTESIARFINIIETQKLNHQSISVFAPTNLPGMTWIKPADFWTFQTEHRGPIRKSLFTALLRSAMSYNIEKDNFNKALFSIDYTKNTKAAVEYFFQGNTWVTPKGSMHSGWYDMFRNASTEVIGQSLTKKPISKVELLQFLLGRLEIKSPEIFVTQIESQEPNDSSLLAHALTLLHSTKEQIIEGYKKKRKSLVSMLGEALQRLELSEEEAIKAFKRSKLAPKISITEEPEPKAKKIIKVPKRRKRA